MNKKSVMGFLFIELAIVIAIVLIGTAIGWEAYNKSHRPTIEIKKDDWKCVKSEQRTSLQPMLIGNLTILQPMIESVCVEYKRHAG